MVDCYARLVGSCTNIPLIRPVAYVWPTSVAGMDKNHHHDSVLEGLTVLKKKIFIWEL